MSAAVLVAATGLAPHPAPAVDLSLDGCRLVEHATPFYDGLPTDPESSPVEKVRRLLDADLARGDGAGIEVVPIGPTSVVAAVTGRSGGSTTTTVELERVASGGWMIVHIARCADQPDTQAEPAAAYYPQVWPDGADVSFYFHSSVPDSTAWRDRIRAGAGVWTALGGAEEPDFVPQSVSSTGYNCNTPRSAVRYADLNPVDPAALGLTFVCTGGGTYVRAFSLTIDSSGRSWYAGTQSPASGQHDLWAVVTHEFGHATGWYGHLPASPTCNVAAGGRPTMCSDYFGTAMRTLQSPDVNYFTSAYT